MRSNSVSKVLFTLLSLMLGTSSVMAQGMGTGSVGAVKPGVRNPHTTGEVPLVPPGHGTVAAPEPLTPGVGVVVGRLKHNDGEGRALAGILARLFAFQDQAQLGQWEAQVQGDGSFQFEGLNTRPGLNYVVSAMYQGVVYLSKGASFSEGEKELAAELEVFDSMPTPGPLRVLTSQFYIEPDSASGALHVHEVLMYSNPGSKALIGSQNGTVTLRLDMPMGVSNVQPVQGFLPTQVSVSDQALIYAGPIYPGENQVVIGYQVSPRDSWIFRRGYEYPVDKVEVFMPSGGPAVLSPKLSQLESVELQGRRFEHYVGEAAGGGVTFQVGGASLSDDGGPKNVPAESLALGIGLGLIGFVG